MKQAAVSPTDPLRFALKHMLKQQYVTSGKTVRLKCYITGAVGDVEFVWTKDNTTLPQNVRTSASIRRRTKSILRLTHAAKDDSGAYGCTARDRAGRTIYRTINLFIIGTTLYDMI